MDGCTFPPKCFAWLLRCGGTFRVVISVVAMGCYRPRLMRQVPESYSAPATKPENVTAVTFLGLKSGAV
jgi:hypothetical protein